MNNLKSTGFQDQWVISMLNGKRGGYFIEAGGLDGIEQSNTYGLEKDYGWTGICFEPTPWLFELMVKNRSCICDNGCLAESHQEVEFVVVDQKVRGLGGILDCIRHPHAVNLKNTIHILTEPLQSALERHGAPKIIDYLSLDAEGSEFRILKAFPFDRYMFRCITVETSDCNELLLANGYTQVLNPLYKDVCEVFFINVALL
jgi:hypothetical protein